MADDDHLPISAQQAKQLFARWASAPVLILAVSGGPDSIALMWLAARWRRSLKRGPGLTVVTIDHGLRPEAAREARDVKRLAASLDLPHKTMRWTGDKPKAGLAAAARDARYALLAHAARKVGAVHVMTAHTRDDQAETVLMRMARGSGLAGLGAMSVETERDGIQIVRPLLRVSKAALIATLDKAGIAYAVDPTNTDPHFTRPRLRALMPGLAAEGLGPHTLTRLAARMARADAALELMVDGAERFLALRNPGRSPEAIDTVAFMGLAEEIRVRLLLRMINAIGHEGPTELGKVESLSLAMEQAMRPGGNGILLKQTLAGAVISLTRNRLKITPAPLRRSIARKRP
ncbi:tRNA lysidine(34) synthetase TilS [Rhodopseudomonas boonkerdii]|uniref:tRNA lysidine(34) synthetase TilS n=1 Tax=Rhodopseudomonas boonkerdii TaxID=475937 RepID=UPI001E320F46|nr:tRNA lysidine(34) synthetase TilS [Rhodopseudomonas boonkerdii]UGV25330.1 tRNA lysidine(34) synthetase TilS [Rhodopseudomonas boonkerdii]